MMDVNASKQSAIFGINSPDELISIMSSLKRVDLNQSKPKMTGKH